MFDKVILTVLALWIIGVVIFLIIAFLFERAVMIWENYSNKTVEETLRTWEKLE